MIYNVAGGGESHLYGTEGPLYYLRNGFNNFNFCFVLALLFLGILPIAKKKYAPDLLIVISPIYIWLGFMSLQPHKEERLASYFPGLLLLIYHSYCDKYNTLSQCTYKAYHYVLRLKWISISYFDYFWSIQVHLFWVIPNIAFGNWSLDGCVNVEIRMRN